MCFFLVRVFGEDVRIVVRGMDTLNASLKYAHTGTKCPEKRLMWQTFGDPRTLTWV